MRQIAFAAGLARRSRPAIAVLRRFPGASPVLGRVMGYRRPFPTLEAAQAAVLAYEFGGHVHPDNAANHMTGEGQARPGDYAALFHLARLLPRVRRVADIGGKSETCFIASDATCHCRTIFDGRCWICRSIAITD